MNRGPIWWPQWVVVNRSYEELQSLNPANIRQAISTALILSRKKWEGRLKWHDKWLNREAALVDLNGIGIDIESAIKLADNFDPTLIKAQLKELESRMLTEDDRAVDHVGGIGKYGGKKIEWGVNPVRPLRDDDATTTRGTAWKAIMPEIQINQKSIADQQSDVSRNEALIKAQEDLITDDQKLITELKDPKKTTDSIDEIIYTETVKEKEAQAKANAATTDKPILEWNVTTLESALSNYDTLDSIRNNTVVWWQIVDVERGAAKKALQVETKNVQISDKINEINAKRESIWSSSIQDKWEILAIQLEIATLETQLGELRNERSIFDESKSKLELKKIDLIVEAEKKSDDLLKTLLAAKKELKDNELIIEIEEGKAKSSQLRVEQLRESKTHIDDPSTLKKNITEAQERIEKYRWNIGTYKWNINAAQNQLSYLEAEKVELQTHLEISKTKHYKKPDKALVEALRRDYIALEQELADWESWNEKKMIELKWLKKRLKQAYEEVENKSRYDTVWGTFSAVGVWIAKSLWSVLGWGWRLKKEFKKAYKKK